MRIFVLAAALALGGQAFAYSENLERPLLGLFTQFAEQAATVDACGGSGGEAEVTAKAEQIALWRHPGIWAGITGTRSGYANELSAKGAASYWSSRLKGCPGITGGLIKSLNGMIGEEIDKIAP